MNEHTALETMQHIHIRKKEKRKDLEDIEDTISRRMSLIKISEGY